jgi:hypothetical protein
MNNYIDVKVTVWHRLSFSEQAYMRGLVEIIKEDGLDEVIDEELGFVESDTLYNTQVRIQPIDNDGKPTIIMYENGKEVWNNTIR